MIRSTSHLQETATLGAVVIVATVFTMALGDAVVKYVSADFSLWQIYVLRSLIAIPILLVLLFFAGRLARLRPKSIGWVALRSLLLMMMWIAFYAALPVLSLATIAASYYTGPLFITLFSAVLIGEPVGPRRSAAVLLGFVGVLLILKPGTDVFSYLTLLPIASAMFYALAAIVTRTRCIEERPLVLSLALNISFLAVGASATVGLILWDPTASQADAYPFLLGRWTAMGGREWGILIVLAVLIVVISSGVAKAYQSAPPATIATFDYAYLMFAAFWGFVFFLEVPDSVTILGMILIAGAGMLAISRPRDAGRALAGDRVG